MRRTCQTIRWTICLGALAAATTVWAESPVATARLVADTSAPLETYFGTVRASEISSLSYQSQGCIVEVSDEAQRVGRVEAGHVLVRLDDQRSVLALRTAEARILDLQASVDERQLAIEAAIADDRRQKEDLDFVEKEFQRNSVMLGRGLINESTMETIERRFMEARFASERAKEAITNAEAAKIRAEIALEIGELDLETAKLEIEDFVLAAPFDGIVAGFDANPGDCVQVGGLAARMYEPDLKSVDVFFPISRLASSEGSGLSVGAQVTVTRVNNQTCPGTITQLDSEADPETQFVEATVDVDPVCAGELFLNEAVEIIPMDIEAASTFTVPSSAISGESTVYLVDEDSSVLVAIQADVVYMGSMDSVVRIPGGAGRLIVTQADEGMTDGQAVALPDQT